MLMKLAMKVGQSIVINDVAEFRLTEVYGDQVRLGLNAPRNIAICRGELSSEIKKGIRKSARYRGAGRPDGMLMLARKVNQTIEIGESKDMIVVSVVEVRGDQVCIHAEETRDILLSKEEFFATAQGGCVFDLGQD